MGNLRKYLALQAQAKTGLSSGLFACGLVALVCGILTAGFILLIAFIWLAETLRAADRSGDIRRDIPVGHDRRNRLQSAVAAPNC